MTIGQYSVIYADPPWRYAQKGLQGAAEKHYPTMGIDELCALPVADLAAPDSVLFLWVTFPQLPEALRLIKAWGFTYKSVAFVWLKKNRKSEGWFYGLGFWTRGNAEICLLATRGHPKRQAANVHQFIISPIQEHSRKPEEARDKIVALIVDPMGEYAPLVRRLGGQVVEIAPGSPNHINPMDIQLDLDDDESPLSMKADFLLSLCELVVGGKDGLQPIEKTVIDRCVRLIYRDMALGLGDGKPPLLQDLYEELLKQPEPEARRVATALELYCTGSLNLFNHQTNVKLTAHIVCIVLKGLGENLRKIAMHVTNDFVTSAVNVNFHNGVSTWCYFDEFHILLRDALTASYFVAVWKMLRKKGCVPSALTQNVKDLLASREIEAILDNTDFMILLSQAQSDRAILAKQLGISEHQLSYITHSNSGEGLLFYGDVTIPFVDRFPRGEIYNLLTTRPEDLKNEAKTE